MEPGGLPGTRQLQQQVITPGTIYKPATKGGVAGHEEEKEAAD